jgi:bacteriorhodopsin
MNIVHQSTNLSIAVQALAGIYSTRVMGYTKPKLLAQAVKLELVVTAVQFIFYTAFIRAHDIATMAITRYYDWAITTPLMLISLSSYLVYKLGELEDMGIIDVIKKYKSQVGRIVLFNAVMLLAGYLGEIGYISRELALVVGTLAFFATFQVIYKEMGGAGNGVFNLTAVVWGLYGVAYMLPNIQKNLMYNTLDLVSKNFFAIFLTNEIIQKNRTQMSNDSNSSSMGDFLERPSGPITSTYHFP